MIDSEKILTVHPLYQPIKLSKEDDSAFEKLAGGHFTFDCFCPACGVARTFTTLQRGAKALVDNVALYGILSKGIHQLNEDESRAYFPVLKQAIILILQQDHEARERSKAESELKKQIANISGKLA